MITLLKKTLPIWAYVGMFLIMLVMVGCGDTADTFVTHSKDGKDGQDSTKQGPVGPQGEAGPAGPKGETGARGLTGLQGPAGKDGAQGPKGDQGPIGEKGVDGASGIDGKNGLDGLNGKDGADGKDGAAGSVMKVYSLPVQGRCVKIRDAVWAENEGKHVDIYNNDDCDHGSAPKKAYCDDLSEYHPGGHLSICTVPLGSTVYQFTLTGTYEDMVLYEVEYKL